MQHIMPHTAAPSVVPPTTHTSSTLLTMKADSGAYRHDIRPPDATILHKISYNFHAPTVQLPNNASITATETGRLRISPYLYEQAHVLQDLASASLLSLGQLCDDDCHVILRKHDLKIYKKGILIATGTRNHTDGL